MTTLQVLILSLRHLDAEIAGRAKEGELARLLIATAVATLAPAAATFRKGGDFAAWSGLVPPSTRR